DPAPRRLRPDAGTGRRPATPAERADTDDSAPPPEPRRRSRGRVRAPAEPAPPPAAVARLLQRRGRAEPARRPPPRRNQAGPLPPRVRRGSPHPHDARPDAA